MVLFSAQNNELRTKKMLVRLLLYFWKYSETQLNGQLYTTDTPLNKQNKISTKI